MQRRPELKRRRASPSGAFDWGDHPIAQGGQSGEGGLGTGEVSMQALQGRKEHDELSQSPRPLPACAAVTASRAPDSRGSPDKRRGPGHRSSLDDHRCRCGRLRCAQPAPLQGLGKSPALQFRVGREPQFGTVRVARWRLRSGQPAPLQGLGKNPVLLSRVSRELQVGTVRVAVAQVHCLR
jgi:hypothetical protein